MYGVTPVPSRDPAAALAAAAASTPFFFLVVCCLFSWDHQHEQPSLSTLYPFRPLRTTRFPMGRPNGPAWLLMSGHPTTHTQHNAHKRRRNVMDGIGRPKNLHHTSVSTYLPEYIGPSHTNSTTHKKDEKDGINNKPASCLMARLVGPEFYVKHGGHPKPSRPAVSPSR